MSTPSRNPRASRSPSNTANLDSQDPEQATANMNSIPNGRGTITLVDGTVIVVRHPDPEDEEDPEEEQDSPDETADPAPSIQHHLWDDQVENDQDREQATADINSITNGLDGVDQADGASTEQAAGHIDNITNGLRTITFADRPRQYFADAPTFLQCTREDSVPEEDFSGDETTPPPSNIQRHYMYDPVRGQFTPLEGSPRVQDAQVDQHGVVRAQGQEAPPVQQEGHTTNAQLQEVGGESSEGAPANEQDRPAVRFSPLFLGMWRGQPAAAQRDPSSTPQDQNAPAGAGPPNPQGVFSGMLPGYVENFRDWPPLIPTRAREGDARRPIDIPRFRATFSRRTPARRSGAQETSGQPRNARDGPESPPPLFIPLEHRYSRRIRTTTAGDWGNHLGSRRALQDDFLTGGRCLPPQAQHRIPVNDPTSIFDPNRTETVWSLKQQAKAGDLEAQRKLEQLADDQCPICFDPIVYPVTTVCGHVLCKKCAVKWMLDKKWCPFCKHEHTISELTSIKTDEEDDQAGGESKGG